MSDRKEKLQGLADILEKLTKVMGDMPQQEYKKSPRWLAHQRIIFQLAERVPEACYMTAIFNKDSLAGAYLEAIKAGTDDKDTFQAALKQFKETFEAAVTSIEHSREQYQAWVKDQKDE